VVLLASLSAVACTYAAEQAAGLQINETINTSSIIYAEDVGPSINTSETEKTLQSAVLNLTKPQGIIPYQKRNFDPDVVSAIATYTIYNNSREINNYLRFENVRAEVRLNKSREEKLDELIIDLDKALNNSTMPEDIVLFRGLGGPIVDSIRSNRSYIELGYGSASYDISKPYMYAANNSRDKEGYVNILILVRHKGETSLYIDENEREILLPRGLTWDVIEEVKVERLYLDSEFVPLVPNQALEKVRLLYLKERK
jgi:hypothetical protein